jgi:hypothetical protein
VWVLHIAPASKRSFVYCAFQAQQALDGSLCEVVHAGGALGLGRPEAATTFARNDRPPDVGGAGVQVDVAPGKSKDLTDSQSDREHDGDRGGVTVVVSLGDQVNHFIACEHPSRRAIHLGRLHAVDAVGANHFEIDRG